MTANRVQGGIFTVMVVKIADPYDPALDRDLTEQIALNPNFFNDAPVVLDLKDCLGCTTVADYTVLRQLLRRHRLVAVGVQNASALQRRAAQAIDLAVFSNAGGATRRTASTERTPSQSRTRLVTDPVRSGTQIYARGSDLIIAASVSPGAEIIADGHIHVYGALRGRAIAGAAGDQEARIFTQTLDAELISIAGRYIVNEAIPPEHLRRPVQVMLIEDRLSILGWTNTRAVAAG